MGRRRAGPTLFAPEVSGNIVLTKQTQHIEVKLSDEQNIDASYCISFCQGHNIGKFNGNPVLPESFVLCAPVGRLHAGMTESLRVRGRARRCLPMQKKGNRFIFKVNRYRLSGVDTFSAHFPGDLEAIHRPRHGVALGRDGGLLARHGPLRPSVGARPSSTSGCASGCNIIGYT